MSAARFVLVFCLLIPVVAQAENKPEGAKTKVTYEEHVKPIFAAKCFGCHNTDKKQADLDLTNYTSMMQGGAWGEVVAAGEADSSYLWSLITHDSEPFMPPNQERLPQASLDVIKAWIDGGALENKSSKFTAKPKPKMEMAGPTTKRPEGPPPMPNVLALEPIVVSQSTTAVTAMATSPWAPLIAVAGQKQVLLYHSQTFEPLGILPFPEGVAQVLKFSRNGSLLLAGGGRGSYQGKVIVWNIKTGERVLEVGNEVDAVLAADISADHELIALGGPQRVVRVYNTDSGELAYEITKHTDWIYALEFSPDGVLLATGDRSSGLHLWEASTGGEYLTLLGHKGSINDITWRADSNVVASASEDQSVRLWEVQNGRQLKTWNAHNPGTTAVEFTRDGRIATCGRDKLSKIWDQNGKQLVAFEAFADLALSVTHCDETNRVAAGDWTGLIRVWNAADGKRLGELSPNPPTLQTRLAATQKQVTEFDAQAKQLTAATAAALKKRDDNRKALAAATTLRDTSQKKHTQTTADAAAHQKTLTALDAEIKTIAGKEAALKKAVPELTTAAQKADSASKALGNAAETVAITAKLNEVLKKAKADMAAQSKLLAQKRPVREQTAAKLAAASQQIKPLLDQINSAKATIAKVTPQVKPLEDQYNAAKQKSDVATAQLAKAKADVPYLQQHIELVKELKAVDAQFVNYETIGNASVEMQESLKAVLTEQTQAQAKVVQAEAAAKAELGKEQAIQKQIAGLKTQRMTAETTSKQLQAALPKLDATLKQLQDVAKAVPGDKDIAGSVASLKTVIDAKRAAIPALATAMKQAGEKLTASEKQLVAAKAKTTQATTAVDSAKKVAVAATAKVKPMQDKAQQARAQVDAAKKLVDAAQQKVDQRRQQINKLRGTPTPAKVASGA